MNNEELKFSSIIDRERTAITDTLIHRCDDDSAEGTEFLRLYGIADDLAEGESPWIDSVDMKMLGRLARIGLASIGEHDPRVSFRDTRAT